MSEPIFRLNEQELDRMLGAARLALEGREIEIADGSAREALVWAVGFSTEKPLGDERQRVAATITLNDEAPLSLQSVATRGRVAYRAQRTLRWDELRRDGMAAVVDAALKAAEHGLQVRTGIEFAHDEVVRRCALLLDLISDDVPDAVALRETVAALKRQAEERTLFSSDRRLLITGDDFGHLADDIRALNEFYETNIFSLECGGEAAAFNKPPSESGGAAAALQRPSLFERVPRVVDDPSAKKPLNVIGIILLMIAIAVITAGLIRHSWSITAGGAAFLLLVIRAMWQWRG